MDVLLEADLPNGETIRSSVSLDVPKGAVINKATLTVHECVNGWPFGNPLELPARVIEPSND